MGVFFKAFAGRIFAAAVLAYLVFIGFGPDHWVQALTTTNPLETSLLIVRIVALLAALIPIFLLFWIPAITAVKQARLVEDYRNSPTTLTPMMVTDIAEYVRDQSAWGWKEYARLNFWRFVQDQVPAEMTRAAAAGQVRFIGTPPNQTTEDLLTTSHWRYAGIDGSRIWDRRNEFFTNTPNVRSSLFNNLPHHRFGKAPRIDVMRAWPRASIFLKCKAVAFVRWKLFWYWLTGQLNALSRKIRSR